MIETKYGTVTREQFEKYKKSIIGRIYAILPMKEEGSNTVTEYINSLNRELINTIGLFDHCEHIISVVCLLDWITTEENHTVYRKEILRCCNIISRIGGTNV